MAADRRACKSLRATPIILLLLAHALTACGASNPELPGKIALLAPFEGQYRDIGYNALYAARLAFGDAKPQDIQLMAIDDGGTRASAVARVRALNLDPAVLAIIALGPVATDPSTQMANSKPLILIGNWGQDRADEDSLYAANARQTKARGRGDLDLLLQTRKVVVAAEPVSFVSSGAPPDADFRERYLNSAMYAPAPNWLATLTYDIARLTLAALAGGRAINTAEYLGLNGLIRFEDGYWLDAPLNRVRLEGDQLVLDAD
ncbi:MAG: hypothetical protein OXG49_04775 [Chloroflexi bacterium]|nr:hypothetical protein [Chloroflexota bacterium]